MTPARFAKLAPLDRVIVGDFGFHPGVVVEKNPVTVIQGRSAERRGWIKVRLDDGREWNGDRAFVAFNAPRSRKAA